MHANAGPFDSFSERKNKLTVTIVLLFRRQPILAFLVVVMLNCDNDRKDLAKVFVPLDSTAPQQQSSSICDTFSGEPCRCEQLLSLCLKISWRDNNRLRRSTPESEGRDDGLEFHVRPNVWAPSRTGQG